MTALAISVRAGNGKITKLLLDRGADINIDPSRLFMAAASFGHGKLLCRLIERGIQMTAEEMVSAALLIAMMAESYYILSLIALDRIYMQSSLQCWRARRRP